MTSVFTTIPELRAQTKLWRAQGETIALVPTMGALHAGHASLIAIARARAKRVVATIFVNPTQFAPSEDFALYPRSFEGDLAILREQGADGVFHPRVDTLYPAGFSTLIEPGGAARAGLEDAFRPTHFAGVATIVAKLFAIAAPDVAVFGEKDYQQLAMIRRMTVDLDMPVDIVGAPIMREADGLALSSRNIYLDANERAVAPTLFATLQEAATRLSENADEAAALRDARARLERAGFSIDYLEARDAGSLGPAALGAPRRLLVAARLGRTRLIDNVAVEERAS